MSWEEFWELIMQHRGKITGILLGLLLGWAIITYGFFHTVFVMMCIIIGYLVGRRIDQGNSVDEIFDKMFGDKRR